MDSKFLRLCSKSIKANRDKFGRDFAIFSNKRNKKTRKLLQTKRSDTFGNWPIVKSIATTVKANDKPKAKQSLSITELEQQTKQNLLNARKLRRRYDIYVFPESETTPLPIFKFEELSSKLKVNKTVCNNLNKWKIKKPLPVQMQVIPIMIQGHEVQCCAPTGSGKTIAFIIPILTILQRTIQTDNSSNTDIDTFCDDSDDEQDNDTEIDTKMNDKYSDIKCLIIAPTTVLAHQIYREFVKYSNGLDIGILLLDEDDMNEPDIAIHIMISTPKPLATLIRDDQIPFNKLSDSLFIIHHHLINNQNIINNKQN